MVERVVLGLVDPELVLMVQLVLVHVTPQAHLASLAQATLVLYLTSSHNYHRHP